MGMILRIASSRIVGQGDIVGRSGYFSLNLSANSVMRGRLDARRTLKSLVADLRIIYCYWNQDGKYTFVCGHGRAVGDIGCTHVQRSPLFGALFAFIGKADLSEHRGYNYG